MNGIKKLLTALTKKRPKPKDINEPIFVLSKPVIEKPKMPSNIAPSIPPGIARIAPMMAHTLIEVS